MDILDALADHRAVRHITTRHEQGAAFMADVYGRLTGRAAVAMATLGPGATNLVTGVADAFLDRAPMVAITGQASSDKLHKEAHQVVDIVGMLEPVTKWNTSVERIEAIPEIVRKAFRVAMLEKPGPTHIELPENLAAMAVEPDATPLVPGKTYFPEPTDEAIGHAADLIAALRAADRPRRQRRPPATGGGRAAGLRPRPARPGRGDVHGQGRDRRPLAPVADGRRAPGARPRPVGLRPGRPRHLRRLRPRRVRAGRLEPRRQEADHPHRHPARRGRRPVPARGRADRRHRRLAAAGCSPRSCPVGSAAATPGSGTKRARRSSTPTSATRSSRISRPARLATAGRSSRSGRSPTSGAALGPDDIVVSDVGAHKVWVARLYQAYEPNTVIISNGFAAMGISLPGRDRGQARPPGPQGRRAVRRRRLPDEQPGARDREADRREHHGRHLARRRLRADRLEAAQRVRAAVRRSSSATPTSSPTPSRSGSPGSGRRRPPTSCRRSGGRSTSTGRPSSRSRSTTARTFA